MKYHSTRDQGDHFLNSAQTIIQGLAPDGGLFVPVQFPQPDFSLSKLAALPYQDLAKTILSWFFDDFTSDQLHEVVTGAYGSQWDDAQIAPLSDCHSGNYYLELYHGPTLAFKDIALQVLPRLMTKSVDIENITKDIVILTATSGDTGTASMRGFSDQPGTRVIVFYPHGGVSPVQLQQMLGQKGKNLSAVAIEGNFDDAQTAVKKIFNDAAFNQQLDRHGYQFSSANSMNIGRLIPQIVYYFSAYGRLIRRDIIQSGDQVNFTVPTGNFGDILAGYYAKKLGLPIHKLICASDENNVLTDFFNTGKYDRQRQFYLTNSPAMDILVSSNLERLLFDLSGQDASAISKLMESLNQNGHYQVNAEVKTKLDQVFAAGFATQKQVLAEIKRVYQEDEYVIDPHTAVASFVTHQYQAGTGDQTPTVIVSTASPYKFPETVYNAITGQQPDQTGLDAIHDLQSILEVPLSDNVQSLFDQNAHQETVIQPNLMEDTIGQLLKI